MNNIEGIASDNGRNSVDIDFDEQQNSRMDAQEDDDLSHFQDFEHDQPFSTNNSEPKSVQDANTPSSFLRDLVVADNAPEKEAIKGVNNETSKPVHFLVEDEVEALFKDLGKPATQTPALSTEKAPTEKDSVNNVSEALAIDDQETHQAPDIDKVLDTSLLDSQNAEAKATDTLITEQDLPLNSPDYQISDSDLSDIERALDGNRKEMPSSPDESISDLHNQPDSFSSERKSTAQELHHKLETSFPDTDETVPGPDWEKVDAATRPPETSLLEAAQGEVIDNEPIKKTAGSSSDMDNDEDKENIPKETKGKGGPSGTTESNYGAVAASAVTGFTFGMVRGIIDESKPKGGWKNAAGKTFAGAKDLARSSATIAKESLSKGYDNLAERFSKPDTVTGLDNGDMDVANDPLYSPQFEVDQAFDQGYASSLQKDLNGLHGGFQTSIANFNNTQYGREFALASAAGTLNDPLVQQSLSELATLPDFVEAKADLLDWQNDLTNRIGDITELLKEDLDMGLDFTDDLQASLDSLSETLDSMPDIEGMEKIAEMAKHLAEKLSNLFGKGSSPSM